MEFEWDNNKNIRNLEKHGLDFQDAERIFWGEIITFKDERYNYGEDRFITLGTLLNRVVIIVHTYRNFTIRIISMRKANEREKNIYYKRLGEIG
jgi:uncharacterized DUF497 family protein